MQAPSGSSPVRGPSRRASVLVAALVALVVAFFVLKALAVVYTDDLWFGSLGYTSVWSEILVTKLLLGFVFTAVFALGMWANLTIVERVAPPLSALGPEDELVRRYRAAVGRRQRLVRALAALVLGLLVGAGAASQWQHWLLFRNAVSFGVKDPQFHKDVGFYVFKLPFLSFLVSWGFAALTVMAVVTVAAHYLNGGIRLQGPSPRVRPQVKAQVSVLLGLLALVKAAGYFLQRYDLDTSTSGYREGAFYTDVHAKLPALTILVIISLIACAIFVWNIWRQGWVLPVIGVGLWAFVSIALGAVYPAAVQAFVVQPAQVTKELPYIARNIAATRAAMGLDHVEVRSFAYAEDVTPSQAAADAANLEDVRLWDPQLTLPTFQKLQDIRSYYQFVGLAVDRYEIDGRMTPVIVGVRQLNASELPARSWVNLHLQYTHGYGAILAPANVVDASGNPRFMIENVPPTSAPGAPVLTQPSVYFGLPSPGEPSYVIVDSKQPEIDYQKPDGTDVEGHYHGTGGVRLGSFIRRAAFAIRFGDINPLISSLVTSQSRILYVRDVLARAETIAPFLVYGSHPYPVIDRGRIFWVLNGYTITDRYPYAQEADVTALDPASGLRTSFNYVRNSVKVVVDAYNGTVTFYAWDPRDPILKAYMKAFPRLFRPASSMPAGIRAHLRYPKDLFTVQAAMYGRYHITDPTDFYNAGDAWELSQDPNTTLPAVSSTPPTTGTVPSGLATASGQAARMSPIYELVQLPGQGSVRFSIVEPFVPVSPNDQQQNLTAFMVGMSGPTDYGKLEVFVTPRGEQVDGPALVNARIQQNTEISQEITLLDSHGSTVKLGSVMMVPIGQSLLYVRPLYVQSSQNALPQVQEVIVVYGRAIAMEPTLSAAVAQVLGAAVPGLGPATVGPTPGSPSALLGPPSGSSASGTVAQLIAEASQALAQAQADLRAGNLGAYQAEVDQAAADLHAAQAAEAASGSSGAPASGASGGSATAEGAAPSGTAPTTTQPSSTTPGEASSGPSPTTTAPASSGTSGGPEAPAPATTTAPQAPSSATSPPSSTTPSTAPTTTTTTTVPQVSA